MNDYTGKVCPFCKTEFTENDDIVICSTCDMPHHKECWAENQGCTTFGCMGTIKNADGTQDSVTATEIDLYGDNNSKVFCTKCGAQNESSSAFCIKCGNRLTTPVQTTPIVQQAPAYNTVAAAPVQNTYAQPQTNTYTQQPLSYTSAPTAVDVDATLIVGPQTGYYIPRFMKLNSLNQKISWNWSAFLFAPFWFIYRKMYVQGASVLAASLLLTLVSEGAAPFIALLGFVAVGLLGNYAYKLRVEKFALEMKSMDQFTKASFVQKNGGVNQTLTIIAVIGYALLSLFFISQ